MNFLIAAVIFIVLFILMLASAIAGRLHGRWRKSKDPKRRLLVLNVAEGAVFALLGLLIAFTFTGAYERFEGRKLLIIDEANAIELAYLQLDLLAPNTQPDLRRSFREYHDSRMKVYQLLPDIPAAEKEYLNTQALRNKIWHQAVAACDLTNKSSTTELLIPAITHMFEVAHKRLSIIKVHPPFIIFGFLIGLAMLSSYLAGYSSAQKRNFNPIYILSYVFITAFTIYLIIDLELPRLGLVNVNAFDKVLADVRHELDE